MGWQDREYNSWRSWEGRSWRDGPFRLPPRGVMMLIAIHVFGAISVLALRLDHDRSTADEALRWMMLSNESPRATAILLHAISPPDVFALITTVAVVWMLGSRIEESFGPRRLWSLYVLGNVLAGLAFFVIASAWPAGASAPLTMPLGAFAAWSLVAWRTMRFDYVSIFGKLVSVATLSAVLLGVAAAFVVMGHGAGAVAWSLGAVTGAGATPIVESVAALLARAGARRPLLPQRVTRLAVRDEFADDVEDEVESDSNDDAEDFGSVDVEIDTILAKISRAGMQSLTTEERARLEAARQAKLKGDRTVRAR